MPKTTQQLRALKYLTQKQIHLCTYTGCTVQLYVFRINLSSAAEPKSMRIETSFYELTHINILDFYIITSKKELFSQPDEGVVGF